MNLAAEMAKLPEPPNDSHPPLWQYWQHDLWRRAQDDDPANFMQWPCIYHTMLQDHWPESINVEYHYLADKMPSELLLILDLDEDRSPSSWRNLIHQTYHILRWQEATGLRIADMQSIYEFGGGYGAMALVCNRLGFTGKYYIYDLPEFALLQQWYLEECGVNNVEWVGELPDDFVNVDLFIACYSLSETDEQERINHLMTYIALNFLLLYSNKFEKFDNVAFFQNPDVLQYLSPQHWRHERIEHLPPESWYTWGWRDVYQPL